MRKSSISLSVACVCLVVAGCGAGSDAPQRILVSAAASLTDAFGVIELAYEETHPGTDVVLNLGGSSALREQILAGAPADVFASANETIIQAVVDGGEASGEPVTFAGNRMQIAVPEGNPAGVADLSAFADDRLVVGLCASGVPCGDLARTILEASNITPSIDTDEPNVRALVTKIEAGEIDVGLVYATDVVVSAVDAIAIPDHANAESAYPIVALGGAPNPDGAQDFVDFVLSSTGQAILADFGFST